MAFDLLSKPFLFLLSFISAHRVANLVHDRRALRKRLLHDECGQFVLQELQVDLEVAADLVQARLVEFDRRQKHQHDELFDFANHLVAECDIFVLFLGEELFQLFSPVFDLHGQLSDYFLLLFFFSKLLFGKERGVLRFE